MFKPLVKDNIRAIIGLMIKDLNNRISDKELSVRLTDRAMDKVIDSGYDPLYGARPLKRYIQKTVETLCARLMLEGKAAKGDNICIDTDGIEFTAFTQTD